MTWKPSQDANADIKKGRGTKKKGLAVVQLFESAETADLVINDGRATVKDITEVYTRCDTEESNPTL